jgi:hypothetical protein
VWLPKIILDSSEEAPWKWTCTPLTSYSLGLDAVASVLDSLISSLFTRVHEICLVCTMSRGPAEACSGSGSSKSMARLWILR